MTIDGSVYFPAAGPVRLLGFKQAPDFDRAPPAQGSTRDRQVDGSDEGVWSSCPSTADSGFDSDATSVFTPSSVSEGTGSTVGDSSQTSLSETGRTSQSETNRTSLSDTSRAYQGEPTQDAQAEHIPNAERRSSAFHASRRTADAMRRPAQSAHVNMAQLADWLLAATGPQQDGLHGVVKDLIEAFRKRESTLDIAQRKAAFDDFIRRITTLDSGALTSIHSAFLADKELVPVRAINAEIALAVDKLPLQSACMTGSRQDAIVSATVDAVMAHAFDDARRVRRAEPSIFPSPQEAVKLAGRDCLSVGLTTLVREAVRAVLNNAVAPHVGEGGRIALALTPTTLSVFLVAKDIIAHGKDTGRWRDGPQMCRMLLALSALTGPALLLALGKAPGLAASFSSTLPTFIYTASRDVLQTYLPAGKSWQKNALGVMAITAGYSAAQLGFAKIMGALAHGLSALRHDNRHAAEWLDANRSSPYSTLSASQVDAVETSLSEVMAPGGWEIATLAFATAVINWGVEYADNVFRPPLYWAGARIAKLSNWREGNSPPERPSPAIHSVPPAPTPTPISANSARTAPTAERALSPSFLRRLWDNDGRRSCTFLGIVGLLGAADQFSTLHAHDPAMRAQTQDVAMVAAMLLLAGLYAGAQDDAAETLDTESALSPGSPPSHASSDEGVSRLTESSDWRSSEMRYV